MLATAGARERLTCSRCGVIAPGASAVSVFAECSGGAALSPAPAPRAAPVKLYDKAYTAVGNVLRAEATLTNVADLRVYRPLEGDPDGELAWRVMRRGIADLHRRAEISGKITARYVDALASVDDETTLDELLRRLSQPAACNGRRVRALRPLAADDSALLAAVSRAEFTLNRASSSASRPRPPPRRVAARPGSVASSGCFGRTG